jgi:cobalt-precorrin-5B (C1)-methyltransferase
MVGKEGDEQFYRELELAEKEQELPPEIQEKMKRGALRTGYTTGTTACAATKAAIHALITGTFLEQVVVSLPKGKNATLKVAWTENEEGRATSAVIKDGGDDPDVTSGAEICSTVSFSDRKGEVDIDGGKGVGRVTKPGLGLEVGKAAINPTPMKMLVQAVLESAGETLNEKGIQVVVSVPRGEEIAKKTDNPRLGILGGISILGTTGIVLPYSTASFAAAIRQGLDVAIAAGADSIVLTTGGRSEDFAKAVFPSLPDHCFVQMGDFAGYSVKQCANKKLKRVTIAGFIGKLTKMAMGIKQTHVAGSHVNMEFMASLAGQCGAPGHIVEEIRTANTARHVSEIVSKHGLAGYSNLMCQKVHEQMSAHAGAELDIQVIMFEFDGTIVGKYPN